MYLLEDTIQYIENYGKENGGLKIGQALEKIIEEHKKLSNRYIDDIANAVVDKLHNDLVRIRLGTNTADRNTKVILELLNHVFIDKEFKKEYKNFITTEKYKSKSLIEAEAAVKKQVDTYRLKRLEREVKQKGE